MADFLRIPWPISSESAALDHVDQLAEKLTIFARQSAPLLTLQNGQPVRTPAYWWLSERSGSFDFIILDPLIRWHELDENNPTHATRIVEALEDLTSSGATVLVTHHVRKTSEDSLGSDAARGSSAFRDGARWMASMAPLPSADVKLVGAENARSYFRFDVCKANNAPYLPKPITLRRGLGGVLSEVSLDSRKVDALGEFIAAWVADNPDLELSCRAVEKREAAGKPMVSLMKALKSEFTKAPTWAEIRLATDAAVMDGRLLIGEGATGGRVYFPRGANRFAPGCPNPHQEGD